MKVVLFCGGLGTRLKEYSETIPKPMVEIGYRPIIWHLMRYYAHFGHKDFILCLGFRGDYIKNYFLNYNECLSNNFKLSKGGKSIHLYRSDIDDWSISFVDTGLKTNIGQRLARIQDHIGNDEVFLANYSDGLTDLDLDRYLEYFYQRGKTASFLCARPSQAFHTVNLDPNGQVTGIQPVDQSDIWINGGFFIFTKQIFDYVKSGEELVEEPFHRLIEERQLIAYRNPGFWACMDTLKEKALFDEMYARGEMPWAVWEREKVLANVRVMNGVKDSKVERGAVAARYRAG
jgi:glucose-1-phosphate cytidylyltransferase